jgi:hypothetical protein
VNISEAKRGAASETGNPYFHIAAGALDTVHASNNIQDSLGVLSLVRGRKKETEYLHKFWSAPSLIYVCGRKGELVSVRSSHPQKRESDQ